MIAKEEIRRIIDSKTDFPDILMDVYYGRMDQVKAKLKKDPSLISIRSQSEERFWNIGRMPKGTTPLLMACICGHIDLVRWLIDHGADLEECDVEGFNAINAACWGGNVQILTLLVQRGAKLCTANSINGMSISLHHNHIYASLKGHEEIMNYLSVEGSKAALQEERKAGKYTRAGAESAEAAAVSCPPPPASFLSFSVGLVKNRSSITLFNNSETTTNAQPVLSSSC